MDKRGMPVSSQAALIRLHTVPAITALKHSGNKQDLSTFAHCQSPTADLEQVYYHGGRDECYRRHHQAKAVKT